jgi:glycosyltransferase involved in cell wall biosynthesis
VKVVIVVPSLSMADAVGHDVLEERACLKEEGIDVSIYTERYSDDIFESVDPEALEFIRDKSSLLIYHHAIYWEKGEEILRKAKGKVAVKYHNITPAHFFLPYTANYALYSLLGRSQTASLARMRPAFLLADSLFNAEDFLNEDFPQENVRIVPPFHRVSNLACIEPDKDIVDRLQQSGKSNVLFVGRVAPNKGHRHMIKTAFYYRLLFGDDVHFYVVGSRDHFLKAYHRELDALVGQLKLKDWFTFTGRVSESQLKSYYGGSRVFLCLSEHEGFCVPILESQYFKVPIVACEKGAVKDTIGKEQLTFNEIDYELFASALNKLSNSADARDYLTGRGYENFANYERSCLKKRFIGAVREVMELR